VDGWVVIPRALYDNDLSDLELQELYVREARKKADDLARRLRALDEERRLVAAMLAEALAFVAEAEAVLGRYREAGTPVGAPAGRATVAEVEDATFRPARRALPAPQRRRRG
jgi:hypothetical protein